MAKPYTSPGQVVETDYDQKHSELGCEVEKIHRDLTQRYNQPRKVDFLEDVSVSKKSLGNLIHAIKEKVPGDKTGHEEYQKRQTAGWNSDYQSKDNGKDQRCEKGLHKKPERT